MAKPDAADRRRIDVERHAVLRSLETRVRRSAARRAATRPAQGGRSASHHRAPARVCGATPGRMRVDHARETLHDRGELDETLRALAVCRTGAAKPGADAALLREARRLEPGRSPLGAAATRDARRGRSASRRRAPARACRASRDVPRLDHPCEPLQNCRKLNLSRRRSPAHVVGVHARTRWHTVEPSARGGTGRKRVISPRHFVLRPTARRTTPKSRTPRVSAEKPEMASPISFAPMRRKSTVMIAAL